MVSRLKQKAVNDPVGVDKEMKISHLPPAEKSLIDDLLVISQSDGDGSLRTKKIFLSLLIKSMVSDRDSNLLNIVDGFKIFADKSILESFTKRAEDAANIAESFTNANTYYITPEDPDGTIAGIAGTPVGEMFRVAIPDAAGGTVAFNYYLNNEGVAEFINSEPNKRYVDEYVNSRLVPGSYTPEFFPAFHDQDGNVPAWFDNSRLDAAGLGPVLQNIVTSLPNAWSQQQLRQFNFRPEMMPLWFDESGNVPVWLDNSRIDAAGFGPILSGIISRSAGVGRSVVGDTYKTMLKKSQLFSGSKVSLNIAFTGDSWTEKNTIPKSLINVLNKGYKDPGWISCSTRADGEMAGIKLSVSGFTKYDGDNENANSPPPYGAGPDGNAYYVNNKAGSLTWSNVTATDLNLFYYDGSGEFTITIDDGEPVTITGGNTGTVIKHDISGLAGTAHTVKIQSAGSGVVSILGIYGKNSTVPSGVTISRMGNGGAMAKDYLNWDAWIEPVVKHLDIDMLFVILGTNDFRKSAGLSGYRQGIESIISHYKRAIPDVCICLVSPAQSNATGTPSLSEYDDEMRRIAEENGVNYISGYKSFPDSYDNTHGTWADRLHLSSTGAYILTNQMKNIFFQE